MHVAIRNGRRNLAGDRPAAFITMISESVASLLSVCMMAIKSASGAMIMASSGMANPVTPRNTRIDCPCPVIRSMPRNACVIQMTPVSDTRTIRKDSNTLRTM